jgi:hypothetical protein
MNWAGRFLLHLIVFRVKKFHAIFAVMTLLCRTLTGHPYEIEVNDDTTVRDVRIELSNRLSVQLTDLTLLHRAEPLSDSRRISSIALTPTEFLVIYTSRVVVTPAPRPIVAAVIVPPEPAGRIPIDILMAKKPPRPQSKAKAPTPRDGPPGDIDAQIRQVQRAIPDQHPLAYIKTVLASCFYDVDATIAQLRNDGPMPSTNRIRSGQIKPPPKQEAKPQQPKPQAPPPEPDVSALARYRFGQHQRNATLLSVAEKVTLLRLLQEFPRADPQEVIQFFYFCDKNYDTTRANLL